MSQSHLRSPGSAGLITRRSQVQILPPLLRKALQSRVFRVLARTRSKPTSYPIFYPLHDHAAQLGWPGGCEQRVRDDKQEQTIGRVKSDSVELDPKAHVASTDQDRFGKIFRRNTPYGTVTNHGTMFVGFASDRRPLATMLESTAGLGGATRNALTRFTRPLTGAYYFVPSTESLRCAAARLG